MWLSQAYTDTDMIHHETLQFKGARTRTHVYTSAYAASDKCISHQPCSWAAVNYKAYLGWRKWKDVLLEKPCVYQTRGLQFICNDYLKKNPEKLNNKTAIYILSIMFLCIIVKKQSRFALKCKP